MSKIRYSNSFQSIEEAPAPSLPTHHESTFLSVEDTRSSRSEKKRLEGRSGCLRCLCCVCCLPGWAAWIVWGVLIAIVIVLIVLVILAGTFVMPSVNLAGVSMSPAQGGSQVSFNQSTLNIHFGLIVALNNPNLLTIDLTQLKATAYYHNPTGPGQIRIGGGYLAEQFVPAYSHFNFTFPFAVQYDSALDIDQSILNDIVTRCGLTGEKEQSLTIDYTIQLTAQVLFIKISPTISSSTTFPCPIGANGALGGLGGGTLAQSIG